MIVFLFGIVVRRAVVQIGLDGGAQTKKHGGIDLSLRGRHDPDRTARLSGDHGLGLAACGSIHQVGLVEDDDIRDGDLILEDLGERKIMLDRGVGVGLPVDRADILGKEPGSDSGSVRHCDDAVDRDARADRRPFEGLDQRFGQRQPGGFDQDMIGLRVERQNSFQRRDEIIGDRAADAAIGEFHHLHRRAAWVAAIGDEVAVEADITELVDDDGDPPPAGMRQHMAHERRLSGTEEAGDDGDGNLWHRLEHDQAFGSGSGGMRETALRLMASGRLPQGTSPTGEAAWSAAMASTSSTCAGSRSLKW